MMQAGRPLLIQRRLPHLMPLACGAIALMHAAGVRAQTVDYGTLTQMFGEPITTSVTGKPQRASDVPGDLVIITQDDIRRSGATTIPDILQFVTGIDMRRYSFGDAQIGVSGYDSPVNPRLLVMVDGRQVYQDDHGFVAWNTIPVQLAEIRQIEVVKGPNSALFGFNAASGVVNIITNDPLFDNVNTATVRLGTQAYAEGEAVGTIHLGTNAGVRVSVAGWRANEFTQQAASVGIFTKQAGDGGIADPRYANLNVDGRWQISPSIQVRLSGGLGDSHTARSLAPTNLVDAADRLKYIRTAVTADTRVGTLDLDAYDNAFLYKNGPIKEQNDVIVTKVSDLLKLDATNTVRLGLEYRSNSLLALDYGIGYENYAVNGMWEWRISPEFDLTNAVRVDHLVLNYRGIVFPLPGQSLADYNSATFTEPSFNSGLVIDLTDSDTVRLTAARGLQLPSLIEYGIHLVANPVTVVGSPTIMPTAVWETKLAAEHRFERLLTADASVFFQRNTNLIGDAGATTPFFKDGNLISTSVNIGSSNEVGFELGGHGDTAGGLRWNASYRFTAIKDDISAALVAAPTALTHYGNGTPRNVVILGAGYTAGKWELDGALRWQSAYTDYFPSFSRGFSTVPLVAAHNVTLNARVGLNLTDHLAFSGVFQQFDVSRLLIPSGSTLERRFIASATMHF